MSRWNVLCTLCLAKTTIATRLTTTPKIATLSPIGPSSQYLKLKKWREKNGALVTNDYKALPRSDVWVLVAGIVFFEMRQNSCTFVHRVHAECTVVVRSRETIWRMTKMWSLWKTVINLHCTTNTASKVCLDCYVVDVLRWYYKNLTEKRIRSVAVRLNFFADRMHRYCCAATLTQCFQI